MASVTAKVEERVVATAKVEDKVVGVSNSQSGIHRSGSINPKVEDIVAAPVTPKVELIEAAPSTPKVEDIVAAPVTSQGGRHGGCSGHS